MTKRRKRRKPEQIVKLLQEGQVMLAAGKSEVEVVQRLKEMLAEAELEKCILKTALEGNY